MFFNHKPLKILYVFILICITLYPLQAFTIDGSKAPPRLFGVPIGGIGAGVFNFLPNGTYSREYCQTKPPTGMEPTIMIYTESGGSKWSTQALTIASGVGIIYTGYWPKVINQYSHSSLKIKLSLEAFSPISPGDNKSNAMPLAFFVFRLENTTTAAVTASIALKNNATASVITEGANIKGIAGNNITVLVKNDDTAQVTSGSDISDFTADGLLSNQPGGILASQVVLQPAQVRTITFVIAWDNVNAYYKKWYNTSKDIAQYGYESAVALKVKLDNWQNKILNSNLPDWYKDVLINNCHVLNSMYDWRDGYAAMQETMSSAGGALGCFDQRYYSSIIVPIFAPDAEYFEMKQFAAKQLASGQIQHGIDGNSGDKSDINSEFALCLLRDYLWTGETRFLTDLYDNAKKALLRNKNWDTDNDGLTDGTYSTFDQPMYVGWMPVESEYPSDVWLAGIKAGQKLADLTNDSAAAADWKAQFTKTSTTFEKINGQHGFWNNTTAGPTGLKGYYTGSNNLTAENGKGRASWASQLGGQWYADLLQLGLLHPQSRIDSVIQYIEALNKGDYGYYLTILPDKTDWFGKWPGDNRCGEQWPWFPPAHFGHPAIANGFPDIGLDCVYRQWKSNYSGKATDASGLVAPGMIPWASPVFMMINGCYGPDGLNEWGNYRYMNPPGVFSTLFAITGFSIDVANKKLWIKPSVPTELKKNLIKAPLINPKSCGTLDYSEKSAGYGQTIKVVFDSLMMFAEIVIRDQNTAINPVIDVDKNGVPIPFIMKRTGSGKSAEILLSFMSGGIGVDKNGITISVSDPSNISHVSDVSANRHAKALIKSSGYGALHFLKQFASNDFVEIYDLKGKLVMKGTVCLLMHNTSTMKFSQGIHIYRIQKIR